MVSKKAVLDKLKEIYKRGEIAQFPKNYIPALIEFAKEIFTNPLLRNYLQLIAESAKHDFESLGKLKIRIFYELNETRKRLTIHEDVTELKTILKEYDELAKKHAPISLKLMWDSYFLLQKACSILLSVKPKDNLLQFLIQIKTDWNNFTPSGFPSGKIEYIFAPSWSELEIEQKLLERKQKNNLWYSLACLRNLFDRYDPKAYATKRVEFIQSNQHFAAHYLNQDAKDLNTALELINTDDALELGIDIEELKIHSQRVWSSIKFMLTEENIATKQQKHISFLTRGSKVTVRYGKNESIFDTNNRTGRFVKTFAKKPHEPLTCENLWAKITNNPQQALCTLEEKQLEETRKSVNRQLKKIGLSSAFEKTNSRKTDLEINSKKIWLNPKYPIQNI